jgi:capsular polysaccharide biosynthesis protein
VSEVPLDAKRTIRSISYHWRLLGVCVLVGALVGMFFAAVSPHRPTASSLVILPPASSGTNGQSVRDMNTEIQIAMSSGVLEQAGNAVRPRLAASTLQDQVAVTATTQDILEIQARADTARAAVALANAVANSYVDYSTHASANRAKQLAASLRSQAARLNQQAAELQTQIAQHATLAAALPRGSVQANAESETLASLQARYGDLVQQVDSVDTQIGNADLGSSGTNAATVLESATTATTPSRLAAARPILLGAAIGLIIGAVLALRRERRQQRLRRRQDIADAVGAPVLASLKAQRVKSVSQLVALLNRFQPDPASSWGLRQILQEAEATTPAPPARVTLTTLAGDQRAIQIAVQFATFCASSGRSTALVIGSRGDPGTSLLRATCQAVNRDATLMERSLVLLFSYDDNALLGSVDLSIRLAIFNPTESLPRDPKSFIVAAVSAGFATAEQLASLARAAAAADQPFRGVLIADPDRYDETSGKLPPEPRAAPLQLLATATSASETEQ